ncbi:hypothetical protein [Paracoccus simplex]|uniref:Uncharacterized protein n=1 Tax=Paracoccus simplex TaxID=2086346 RepID=A0ABV7RWE2_9RHOB
MTRIALFSIGFLLMLAGPLMQGLSGSENPNAYVFAPVMLAGIIPLLAGQALSPSPRLMAQAILICGALCMGAWYLGTLFAPMTLPPAAPVGTAILGALLVVAGNFLLRRDA